MDLFEFEPQGEDCDGTALLGSMQIAGVRFHVNAIRMVDDDGVGFVQEPMKGDATQYKELLDVYDYAMQTVKIPGHPGDWVLVIHPYGD